MDDGHHHRMVRLMRRKKRIAAARRKAHAEGRVYHAPPNPKTNGKMRHKI